jgi:hypothetical protein
MQQAWRKKEKKVLKSVGQSAANNIETDENDIISSRRSNAKAIIGK